MIFKTDKKIKGMESFDPTRCKVGNEKEKPFNNDDVAMGCCEGCWSGCIGFPTR